MPPPPILQLPSPPKIVTFLAWFKACLWHLQMLTMQGANTFHLCPLLSNNGWNIKEFWHFMTPGNEVIFYYIHRKLSI